jgi:hypothetical protein
MTNNSENNILTVALLGIIFGMIHFFGKEDKKRCQEMSDINKKIANLASLCKEMKQELKNIQQQENTIKTFISLSDLAHKNNLIDNGVEYEDCLEQYIEQFSEQCVEQFVDINKDNQNKYISESESEIKSDIGRNRSNSLSSILGTAKKMVFG